jgi:hypothetical protein
MSFLEFREDDWVIGTDSAQYKMMSGVKTTVASHHPFVHILLLCDAFPTLALSYFPYLVGLMKDSSLSVLQGFVCNQSAGIKSIGPEAVC